MIETKASAAVKHQKDAVNEEKKKKKEIEDNLQEVSIRRSFQLA